VRVPPLRERFDESGAAGGGAGGDEHFAPTLHLDEDFIAWLRCRPLAGNLRELRNVLERVRALGLATVMSELYEPPATNVTSCSRRRLHARAEHAWVVQLLRAPSRQRRASGEPPRGARRAGCAAHPPAQDRSARLPAPAANDLDTAAG